MHLQILSKKSLLYGLGHYNILYIKVYFFKKIIFVKNTYPRKRKTLQFTKLIDSFICIYGLKDDKRLFLYT